MIDEREDDRAPGEGLAEAHAPARAVDEGQIARDLGAELLDDVDLALGDRRRRFGASRRRRDERDERDERDGVEQGDGALHSLPRRAMISIA